MENQKEIVQTLEVSSSAIKNCIKLYKNKGMKCIIIKKRKMKIQIANLISKNRNFKANFYKKTPEDIVFEYSLWTIKIIQLTSTKLFNIFISLKTVSNYMKCFGFTTQNPLKDAYEQDSKAATQLLKKDYPKIKKKEKAEIHWVYKSGLRPNCNYIRRYSS